MKDVAKDILTNALAFLEEAAGRVTSKKLNRMDLKCSVLHVVGAIDLILKSRLCLEHWSFIFEKLDDADIKKLQSGDFQSVGPTKAQDRLNAICGIDFLKKHQKLLDHLRKERNKIQHYKEGDYTPEQVTPILAEAFSCALLFIHRECMSMIENNMDNECMYENITKYLYSWEMYIEQRLISIEPIIRDASLVLECPSCLQEAVTVDGTDERDCHFCHSKFTFEDFKSGWSSLMGYHEPQGKDASIEPPLFKLCPECGHEGLIEEEDGDMYPPDPAWFCVYCGHTWGGDEIHICDNCGGYFSTDGDGLNICEGCFEDRVSRW